jgi:hypothetical protein
MLPYQFAYPNPGGLAVFYLDNYETAELPPGLNSLKFQGPNGLFICESKICVYNTSTYIAHETESLCSNIH